MDSYSEAHLFVAAIRVLQHKQGGLPNLEDVCSLLHISVELGSTISRKLHKLGIVETFTDPFSVKLAVGKHLEIEKLPKKLTEENKLAEELAKFQAEKKNVDEKVASLQAEMARKKQDLFADIEAKFKKELEKQKKS